MVSEHLKIEDQFENGHHRIHVEGDLIIVNANHLQSHLDSVLAKSSGHIVLDLTRVNYIDSFGIGVVVKTKSETDKMRGRLRVVVNETIQSLFEKCHLDDYIDLELQMDKG